MPNQYEYKIYYFYCFSKWCYVWRIIIFIDNVFWREPMYSLIMASEWTDVIIDNGMEVLDEIK